MTVCLVHLLQLMNKEFVLTLSSNRITKDFLRELADIFWNNKGEETVLLIIINNRGDLESILELKSMKVNTSLDLYLEILDILQPFRFNN